MQVEYDEAKRRWTLEHRGLDFADAAQVLSGPTLSLEDDRRDYGERRWRTVGRLAGRAVIVVWTSRGDRRRIISMRRCHVHEERSFLEGLDR